MRSQNIQVGLRGFKSVRSPPPSSAAPVVFVSPRPPACTVPRGPRALPRGLRVPLIPHGAAGDALLPHRR